MPPPVPACCAGPPRLLKAEPPVPPSPPTHRLAQGYAFVNFVDARATARLYRQYHNKRWEEFNSKKVRLVGAWGPVQGDPTQAWVAPRPRWVPHRALGPPCAPPPQPQVCEVTYGRVQGRQALVEHFRASKFPCDDPDYQPLVFTRVRGSGGREWVAAGAPACCARSGCPPSHPAPAASQR